MLLSCIKIMPNFINFNGNYKTERENTSTMYKNKSVYNIFQIIRRQAKKIVIFHVHPFLKPSLMIKMKAGQPQKEEKKEKQLVKIFTKDDRSIPYRKPISQFFLKMSPPKPWLSFSLCFFKR